MDKKKTVEEKTEIIRRQVELGEFLNELRAKRGLSLAQLGESLGVSANYLSEIERGLKSPSDYLIREIARYHGIDENKIFEILGRVPLAAQEELNDNSTLQRTLAEIRRNKKLSDEEKDDLYNQIYELYREFINRMK